MARYLIVPGWGGSGPDHWQSRWERDLDRAERVEMSDWLEPRRADWILAIDDAVAVARIAGEPPPVLIGHSLGCIAIAHWAAQATQPVRAALLVAPADVERPTCPEPLLDFAPLPRRALPFPALTIASDDDPYIALERAAELARWWGSGLVPIPRGGHLNAASGLGAWPQGRALLDSLVERAARTAA